ncbi:hypothetical protein NQZ79_g8000 [Umbelopsis isabellina]|nr:hypothetical protein NQZ79_g8000 [Umbelopsis isabellina]
MSTQYNDRVIIQTDVDFFYGQVEELENPALKGQPFGVQQKHIIVTCNYIARARGIKKLQLLTDALKLCPDLVIVNGEDLERYRVASKSIFHLARSIVWGKKVERLGMDELFMDVTEMVDFHLSEMGWTGDDNTSLEVEKEQVFHIKQNEMSFTYNPYTWAGFKIDADGDRASQTSQSQERLTWHTIKLHAASHLAYFIRNQIRSRLGFTCSAGVASSKVMAKLAADAHKPNNQTLLCPNMYEEFIQSLPIRRIMGIGYKTAKTLKDKLHSSKEQPTSADHEAHEDLSEEHPEWHFPDLTVAYIHEHCRKEQFVDWFGDKQGEQTWDLLHGIDKAPVIPTPLIPTQISIEDSFRQCGSIQEAKTRLLELAVDFIKRLESELLTDNTWVKYPTTLRLTTRARGPKNTRAMRDTRISKSDRMPVDIFETDQSIEDRASSLVERSLLPMLRKLVTEPFELTLLNIAAAQLSKSRPSGSIHGYFAKEVITSDKIMTRPDDIDESVWSDLPVDIQRELLYHHAVAKPPALTENSLETPGGKDDLLEYAPSPPKRRIDDVDKAAMLRPTTKRRYSEDDLEFAPSAYETMIMLEDDENLESCHVCGSSLFPWAMRAHRLFHDMKEGDTQ